MADVELLITLSVIVDPAVWRDAYFVSEKGLAVDVAEHVCQVVADSVPAHFEDAIKSVKTLTTEVVS